MTGMRCAIEAEIRDERADDWTSEVRDYVQHVLMQIEQQCDLLELKISAKAAKRAADLALDSR